VASSQARIMQLLGRSLVEQIARLLLDESVEAKVGLPQRTLAAMLGAQRPSVNKVLRQLEDKQIISLGYGEVRILDTSALEKIAGSG